MLSAAFSLLAVSAVAQAQDSSGSNNSSGPTGTSSPTSDWDKLKQMYEAEAAAHTAGASAATQKAAEINAQNELAKAKIGSVAGQTTYTGTVQGYTAKTEAMLMVTRAALESAMPIKRALYEPLKSNRDRDILLLTSPGELDTSSAMNFDLRSDAIKQMGAAAHARFLSAISLPVPKGQGGGEAQGGGERFLAPVAAVGTFLDTAAKLGSYFQSNYSFGDVNVTPTADLLAASLVESFSDWQPLPHFIIPTRTLPADSDKLIGLVQDLHQINLIAIADKTEAERKAAVIRAAHKDDEAAGAVAAELEGAAAAAAAVSAKYDALIADLTAPVTDGREPYGVAVARQKRIQELLHEKEKPLVLILTGDQAAGYYSKSSLWTFLGGPPVYASAGTSTTYTLSDSSTGRVLAAGAVAYHAGYKSLHDISRSFGNQPVTGASK